LTTSSICEKSSNASRLYSCFGFFCAVPRAQRRVHVLHQLRGPSCAGCGAHRRATRGHECLELPQALELMDALLDAR